MPDAIEHERLAAKARAFSRRSEARNQHPHPGSIHAQARAARHEALSIAATRQKETPNA